MNRQPNFGDQPLSHPFTCANRNGVICEHTARVCLCSTLCMSSLTAASIPIFAEWSLGHGLRLAARSSKRLLGSNPDEDCEKMASDLILVSQSFGQFFTKGC